MRPRFTLAAALDWLEAHQDGGHWEVEWAIARNVAAKAIETSDPRFQGGNGIAAFRAYLFEQDATLLDHPVTLEDDGDDASLFLGVTLDYLHPLGYERWQTHHTLLWIPAPKP